MTNRRDKLRSHKTALDELILGKPRKKPVVMKTALQKLDSKKLSLILQKRSEGFL